MPTIDAKKAPEDISVILGRITSCAETLKRRKSGRHLSDVDVANHEDANRILELIGQAQKVVLEAQLERSLKAVQK